jgi:hypothetical protein
VVAIIRHHLHSTRTDRDGGAIRAVPAAVKRSDDDLERRAGANGVRRLESREIQARRQLLGGSRGDTPPPESKTPASPTPMIPITRLPGSVNRSHAPRSAKAATRPVAVRERMITSLSSGRQVFRIRDRPGTPEILYPGKCISNALGDSLDRPAEGSNGGPASDVLAVRNSRT